MNSICIVREEVKEYPYMREKFRPSIAYPEYLFGKEISRQDNIVYDMMRRGFEMLGMDAVNFGKAQWNPLGNIIKQGDTVLLKPNLVLHKNRSGCGTDCLYTHPALLAAMVDYVCIALKGTGKIVIGDAPVQECDFETLVQQSGYDILVDFYKERGIDIELVDFRNVKTYEKDGLHYLQEEEQENGVVVKLDSKSAFADVGTERMQKLRITNYDPRILQQHHYGTTHEYMISKYVLDADVIINMPKPKTHRKAGVTISLKNLVGINTNKEFLPHHTLGSKDEGGDAYLHENSLLKMANEILDIKNQLVHDNEMDLAEMAENLHRVMYERGKKQAGEEYWEGSWYGNDTIWRTIMDLNRIVYYADKNGEMTNKLQRKLFIVGDMIVSGEKEGPLWPTPTYPGTIIMGDDPLKFDRVTCSLMGFDYHLIPTLYNDELLDTDLSFTDNSELNLISNYENWNKKSIEEIREHYSLEFQPSLGWIKKLGNKYRDKLYNRLLEKGSPVYIFGAGKNGIYAMEELKSHGIEVSAFCDNNSQLWGTEITEGIKCIGLDNADKNMPFIVATKEQTTPVITKQIEASGGEVFGIINT
ncbi:MAG: DUF362 domain-containing protein [Lachnospiraceae bacterium]|nr:DUF362 domain-containing protein [Lachnospiraceae bacterium]